MSVYKGKYSFSRIFEILTNRKKQIDEQLNDGRENKQMKKILGPIALAGVIGLGTVVNLPKPDDETVVISEPEKYVVTKSYANIYNQVPEYNKLGVVNSNEIIEFDISDDTSWAENEEGVWEYSSVSDTEANGKWIKCVADINGEAKVGFVLSKYVDKYVVYSGNSVDIRTDSNNKEESSIIGVIENDDEVYVSEKIDNIDSFGNEWHHVIVKKDNVENGEYVIGYVAIDELTKNTEVTKCLGVVNKITYLRTYPVITELQESIINGMVNNGQEVEVLSKCKSGEDIWYECRLDGAEDESVYVPSDAIKNIKDYETEITFEQIGSVPITSSNGEIRATIYPGDTIKVDTSKRNKKGTYPVMANGYTGYVKGEYLDKTKLRFGGKEKFDSPKIIGLNEQENVEDEITYTVDSSEEQENVEDKITYIVDLSDYSRFETYKQVIDEMKEKNKIGAVAFSLGRTGEVANFSLGTFIDDAEEYKKYLSGDTSVNVLQEDFNDIAKKSNCTFNKEARSNGCIKDFVKYVKYTIEQDIPIGYYYYSCAITPNEASAEAAYISAILEKVENDIGEEYKNAVVLPFIVDVEHAGTYRMKHKEERTEAVSLLIDLLGNGTDNKECWTREGYNPREGYNIINKTFCYYADTNHVACTDDQTKALAAENVISLQAVEERTSEYKMIRFLSRNLVIQDQNMKEEYLDPNYILKLMKDNKYYNGKHGEMSKQVTDSADIMQCILDAKYNKLGIDLSITTTGTIQEMLNGTYEHDKYGDFLTKLENVIQAEAERNGIKEEVEMETEMEH